MYIYTHICIDTYIYIYIYMCIPASNRKDTKGHEPQCPASNCQNAIGYEPVQPSHDDRY